MTRTIADQLVATLAGAGVKRIYGLVGDSLNPIADAVRRDGRIQWIHVRHREALSHRFGEVVDTAVANARLAGSVVDPRHWTTKELR